MRSTEGGAIRHSPTPTPRQAHSGLDWTSGMTRGTARIAQGMSLLPLGEYFRVELVRVKSCFTVCIQKATALPVQKPHTPLLLKTIPRLPASMTSHRVKGPLMNMALLLP